MSETVPSHRQKPDLARKEQLKMRMEEINEYWTTACEADNAEVASGLARSYHATLDELKNLID